MKNRKTENTRIVTFKEDYKIKGGKVVYAKDTTHAIHVDTVTKLEKRKVKMDVKTFDEAKKAEKSKAVESKELTQKSK